MTKRTRLLILLACVVLFFSVTPFIVAYSLGYRVDFENREIVATGGIYVRTSPQAAEIIIDNNNPEKPGMFSNAVFVQDLLPRQHSVTIKKDGYFQYQKTLPVKQNEVTKLENVMLFKNNIAFTSLADNIEYISLAPNKRNFLAETTNTLSLDFIYFSGNNLGDKKEYSLPLKNTSVSNIIWSPDSNKALVKIDNTSETAYYLFDFWKETQSTDALPYLNYAAKQVSFDPQDSSKILYIKNTYLYSYSTKDKKSTLLLKNVLTYKAQDNGIFWLSTSGVFSKSDMAGNLVNQMTDGKIISSDYSIVSAAGQILLKNQNSLLIYNPEIKAFQNFDNKIQNFEIAESPDGKNMVYYNSNDIYLYSFDKNIKIGQENNVKLFSSNGPVTNCFWLNNDYIIFRSANKVIISEIDSRGNINSVELPQTYIKNSSDSVSKIFYNPSDSQAYVFLDKALFSSEKLVP